MQQQTKLENSFQMSTSTTATDTDGPDDDTFLQQLPGCKNKIFPPHSGLCCQEKSSIHAATDLRVATQRKKSQSQNAKKPDDII